MYYFTLCDFFYNYKVINYFITLLDQYPNYFINSDICFNAYEGSYSYFYFNGEFNNNNGPITLSQHLKNKNNINKKPIRFSMSNLYLEYNDIYNCYLNNLLKEFDKQGNYIEVSNLDFLNYIYNNFSYNYILSKNIFFTLSPTIENINLLLGQNLDIFSLIQIPENFTFNEIQQLNYRNKIEITINPNCIKCENYLNCWNKEFEYQINYSNKSNFITCQNYKEEIKTLDSLKDFKKLGINHFIIKSNPEHNSEKYLLFLIEYFIKDEFKYNVLKNWREYSYD